MATLEKKYWRGPFFDALLATKMFDYPILWLDVYGVGFAPYLWDRQARKASDEFGSCLHLVGAHWEKFNGQDVYVRHVPPWSTNRGVIWEVIDKICRENLDFYLYTERGEWVCELERYYVNDDEKLFLITADDPQFAVCIAAMELFS